MIEINDLEKIIQVVDKYNISHFEFEHESSKVIIEKQEKAKKTVHKSIEAQINSTNETYLSPISQENVNKIEDKNVNETKIEKEYIKANFAGTFYSKRENDNPEFVKLYDEVNCNTVVGLLEVMKLFNEVEAGVEGTIVDILVKDGEFVEYGQPLFEVKRGERYV